ncbi:MAG: transcriptional repressor [Candidatus Krumholzibacteriota bacterium]
MTSHPTAAELYAVVRRRLPRISLGTIYRNLEVLHEDGIIRKMEFAGSETRFDGNLDEHHHVRCTECDRVDDIHSTDPGLFPTRPEELGGFRITGHRFEYFGVCPECRKRETLPGFLSNPVN